ncbi:hypothetical protein F383_35053 [Gossypium arboreum]|uniref:Uncharacterized protein n=1 Tax=Gossypium arboreum TaxID=29729 RepID=A0A0B0PTK6_GOSAR|nr:hypothetical protein F383_35053 [Gossypium arboreum]
MCIVDLAWTAWTGNPAVRCEVRGSAYLRQSFLLLDGKWIIHRDFQETQRD